MSANILETLSKVPKAELHVHLEGTVLPKTLLELSRRHGVTPDSPVQLPDGRSMQLPPETGAALPKLSNFKDFIRYYLRISDLIRTADDVAFVADEYVSRCIEENIKYIECYFSPTTYAYLGRNPDELFSGLVAGQTAAERRGIRLKWIFDVVRNTSRNGMDTLALANQARAVGVEVVAIGLAGDETIGEPKQFAQGFREARASGYKVLAHSGEAGSAEQMMELQEQLNPERIGHALPVLENCLLVEKLKSGKIVLELCPWSNVALGFKTFENHPIADMFAANLPVVICSDDPGIFGKTLTDNYLFAYERGVPLNSLLSAAERSLANAAG
ncbi:MAG: adenosine deaminase [Bdellovibrionales bacterium]|nr:adenosine deaminase [Bdellovibrionales bacterium]